MKNVTHYLILILAVVFLPHTAMAERAAKKFVVVIDAGHGGHDPGAINKKIKEKDINLKTALKLGSYIEKNCADVQVIYTRKTDTFVELHRRAEIANKAKADLFISIHTNSIPKGTVRGAETYTLGMASTKENLDVAKRENEAILLESNYKATYKGFNPNSSESYIIFEYMQDAHMSQSVNFAKKVQSQFKNNAKRVDKGVKQAGFLVLRETAMPSVLVELGYISTTDEAEFLISDQGSTKMANSIYQAFISYKRGKSGGAEITPVKERETAKAAEPVRAAEPVAEVEETISTRKETPAKEIAAKAADKTAEATAENGEAPVFKVQFTTSDRLLKEGNAAFKGLKNVEYYKEGKIYKYTCGSSTNYNEIYQKRKEIDKKFKGCFIVAFRNGEKMNVNEAIAIFKARKR